MDALLYLLRYLAQKDCKMNNRGATITEVVVVLVIIMILFSVFYAVIASKDNQIDKTYRNEARISAKDIINKERMYYARHGSYIQVGTSAGSNEDLDVELGINTRFKHFKVSVSTKTPYSALNPKITVTITSTEETITGTYDRDGNTEDSDKISFVYS